MLSVAPWQWPVPSALRAGPCGPSDLEASVPRWEVCLGNSTLFVVSPLGAATGCVSVEIQVSTLIFCSLVFLFKFQEVPSSFPPSLPLI